MIRCAAVLPVPVPPPARHDRPLPGLLGSSVADRFCAWSGRSGRRYIVSVFPLDRDADPDDLPVAPGAVLLGIRRAAGAPRRVLWAVRIAAGPLPRHVVEGLEDLARSGEGEAHLHLLAEDGPASAAVFADLAFPLLPARAPLPRFF